MLRHPIIFVAVFMFLLLSLSGCYSSSPVSSAGSKGENGEQVAQNWQRQGVISEQQHIRAMNTLKSIRQTGRVSDDDLNWLLALLTQPTSNPTAMHLLVMAELINISSPSDAQSQKIRNSMLPFEQSSDPTEQQLAILTINNLAEKTHTINPLWMWLFAVFILGGVIFMTHKQINKNGYGMNRK